MRMNAVRRFSGGERRTHCLAGVHVCWTHVLDDRAPPPPSPLIMTTTIMVGNGGCDGGDGDGAGDDGNDHADEWRTQPAIDAVCLDMMRRYNRERPIVFNTYQCYLKETPAKLNEHIRMSEREGWIFSAKLVRGAYMVLERERAAKMGYECPVRDTIQDTHDW